MEKRLFHFSYSLQQSRSNPLLHALRDGDAFAEIAAILLKSDYNYHGLILNFPSPHSQRELPDLGASDLIVLTTRPPTEYEEEFNKKHIATTGGELEKAILKRVAIYFAAHSRTVVKLKPAMAAEMKSLDRGEIQFKQQHGARYFRHRNPYVRTRPESNWKTPIDKELTAAFLLFTNLWDGGPLLLNAFGMDGPTTLIWCYLLRTRLSSLLTPHRLVVAELTMDPFPPRPQSLSFADQWQIEILLNQELLGEKRSIPMTGAQ